MREWEAALERFYAGDAEPGELEALADLDREGQHEVGEALQIARGLKDACGRMGPPSADELAQLLGPDPVLIEDQEETSEEREALLGDDLTRLLGSMPGPPPISELSLPDLEVTVIDASGEVGALQDAAEPEAEADLASFSRDLCQQAASDPGRRLLGEVVDACGAGEATLWVISADQTQLEGALNHVRGGGSHAELEKLSVPLSVSVIGKVASTGQPIAINKADYQDPIVAWTVGVEVTAMVAAPVNVDGQVVGVLSAVNPTGSESFDAEALRQLEWRAYLLGLVLQEARRQAHSRLFDGPIS